MQKPKKVSKKPRRGWKEERYFQAIPKQEQEQEECCESTDGASSCAGTPTPPPPPPTMGEETLGFISEFFKNDSERGETGSFIIPTPSISTAPEATYTPTASATCTSTALPNSPIVISSPTTTPPPTQSATLPQTGSDIKFGSSQLPPSTIYVRRNRLNQAYGIGGDQAQNTFQIGMQQHNPPPQSSSRLTMSQSEWAEYRTFLEKLAQLSSTDNMQAPQDLHVRRCYCCDSHHNVFAPAPAYYDFLIRVQREVDLRTFNFPHSRCFCCFKNYA